MKTEDFWIEAIQTAHADGLPNGWLLGWDVGRHFAAFSKVVKPHTPSNLTSFDYAFCNHFTVRFDDDSGGATVLTVWLSFVAPAASMHWTKYDPGMTAGRVITSVRDPELGRVVCQVERWLKETNFELIPEATQKMRIDGVALELSDASNVTIGKALFLDFDG